MYRNKRVHGFQLYNQLIVHEKVESSFSNGMAFVRQRNDVLARKRKSPKLHFYGQCRFIDRLQVSGTKHFVYFDRRPDNVASETLHSL